MKKITAMLTAVALLSGSNGFAQTNNGTGKGAAASSNATTMWAVGLTSLVIVGVMAGVVAGTAAGSSSTFSH